MNILKNALKETKIDSFLTWCYVFFILLCTALAFGNIILQETFFFPIECNFQKWSVARRPLKVDLNFLSGQPHNKLANKNN